MNKKIQKCLLGFGLTSMILLSTFHTCCAQEAGYFDHYYLQPVMINPGATGFNGDHEFLAAYKLNYTDFPGAPRTFTALYNGSFAEKVGLGFQVLSDHVGVTQLFHAQLNYAYKFIFNNAIVGVGLSTGLQNFRVTDTQNDPQIDPTDPLLNEAIDGYLLFDGSAGAYAEIENKFIFGISFPNVVKQRISEIEGDVHLDLKSFPYAVHFGYRHEVKNYNFQIEPSITVKNLRYSPFLVDLNLKFSFLDEQLVGGLGYTIGDDNKASLLLGTRLDNLRFYYSYDVSIGTLQQFNNGSHEFTLLYRMPAKAPASE
ncbi:MAG: PorP/SprF family type IX secretion system membrane protein [Saprospiraceae bacterium]